MKHGSPLGGLALRIAWGVVLATHVVLAGLVLRFMPHGFPLLHPRFALWSLAPMSVAFVSLALSLGLWRAPRLVARVAPAFPAFWASVALGLLLVFPKTGAVAAWPLLLLALCLAQLAGFTCRGYGLWQWLPGAFVGLVAGQLVARCERPAPPSTQPSREAPPRRGAASSAAPPPRIEMATDLVLESAALRVTWQGRHASISIAPALEFDRTPPDGFWSIFSDERWHPPDVAFASIASDALRVWTSDGTPRLEVERERSLLGPGTRAVRLESWALLERPVYSHLNSFMTVELTGHQRLGLRFSPCPTELIEVTRAEYPTGAPARFAYVDAARRFRVVQAADAEKGPFTTLAEGRLTADATLAIELVELGEPASPFARLELTDFAAEVSTALSPTAGYGVAENAIEFGLESATPSSAAHLLFSLAASGVGRGWDSVGHRAGLYRNRVTLRSLEAAEPPR